MFYILDPSLSGAESNAALGFLDEARPLLSLAGATEVTASNVSSLRPTGGDGVVIVNPQEGTPLPQDALAFVRHSSTERATVLPVAMSTTSRMPPSPLESRQSFDVVEFQALRGHSESYLAPAAQAFAREAFATVSPSCYVTRPRLFLAHRRADGEEIARQLDRNLSIGRDEVFRDLNDVAVGADAQAAIDLELARADAVVFIDTPRAAESKHTIQELRTAIERRLPVVWIRFGDDADRVPLPLLPTDRPHIRAPLDAATDRLDSVAAEVLDKLFHLCQPVVAEALETVRDFEQIAKERGDTLKSLDRRQLIYDIEFANAAGAFPQRAKRHVCQFFGRRPSETDKATLTTLLDNEGLATRTLRVVDAAVLLDPHPTGMTVDDWCVLEHSRDYLARTMGSPKPMDAEIRKLVLLGSFPAEEVTHDETMRAVYDVASEWMRLGGGIVMGGHPTFTPLVVGAAKAAKPTQFNKYLTIYQSEYFVDHDTRDLLALHARVELTRSQGDRDRSLELMRKRMFEHPDLVGAVVIGGKTDHPGVDPEVTLAAGRNMPVLPLAAPGGRAAELCREIDASSYGWSAFTTSPISGPELKQLSARTDYRGIARDLYRLLA